MSIKEAGGVKQFPFSSSEKHLESISYSCSNMDTSVASFEEVASRDSTVLVQSGFAQPFKTFGY